VTAALGQILLICLGGPLGFQSPVALCVCAQRPGEGAGCLPRFSLRFPSLSPEDSSGPDRARHGQELGAGEPELFQRQIDPDRVFFRSQRADAWHRVKSLRSRFFCARGARGCRRGLFLAQRTGRTATCCSRRPAAGGPKNPVPSTRTGGPLFRPPAAGAELLYESGKRRNHWGKRAMIKRARAPAPADAKRRRCAESAAIAPVPCLRNILEFFRGNSAPTVHDMKRQDARRFSRGSASRARATTSRVGPRGGIRILPRNPSFFAQDPAIDRGAGRNPEFAGCGRHWRQTGNVAGVKAPWITSAAARQTSLARLTSFLAAGPNNRLARCSGTSRPIRCLTSPGRGAFARLFFGLRAPRRLRQGISRPILNVVHAH